LLEPANPFGVVDLSEVVDERRLLRDMVVLQRAKSTRRTSRSTSSHPLGAFLAERSKNLLSRCLARC